MYAGYVETVEQAKRRWELMQLRANLNSANRAGRVESQVSQMRFNVQAEAARMDTELAVLDARISLLEA